VEKDLPVVPLPGASAALTALAGSGLPTDQFRFIGFLPPKASARRRVLEEIAGELQTMVAYESPHRILDALADAAEILGRRRLVLARELTKLHEEFLRGTAGEIREELARRPAVKGEFTLVIARSEERAQIEDPASEVERLEREEGLDRMGAIKAVAKRTGVPKREIYRLFGRAAEERSGQAPDSNPRGKHRD
jgi:16S rRNA (cytidine1402-2'-O)-methyltransferase